MKKYLFSLMAIMVFTVLFGSNSSKGCDPVTEQLNCSRGYFFGFGNEIDCWISSLMQGRCGLSACGTTWTFEDIGNG
jgi:hypothetical protein